MGNTMWIPWNSKLEEALKELRIELGQKLGQNYPLSYADLAFRISSYGKTIGVTSINKWCGKDGGVTRIRLEPAKSLLAFAKSYPSSKHANRIAELLGGLLDLNGSE